MESFGLFGSEFTLFPAEIVASASAAPVSVRGVSGPACSTNLEEESVSLSQLLLRNVSNGHGGSVAKRDS